MKTKKKNKKKISKVLFNKVARVASLATTVVASEILTSEKAEASITIGETAGSPNNQSVKKTSAAAVSTAIAIGNNANASNSGSAFAIAIGGDTTSTGNGAISIGKDAQSLASSGVAVGYNSKASGGQAVAIGGNIQNAGGAQATGDQSISIGGDTIASGSSSIAIGGDDLNQANSIAGVVFKNLTGVDLIGTTTYVKTESGGAGSIAIGVQSTSSGHLSTAFGTKTKASGAYSTALGVGASSEGEGSIALGGAASSKGKTSIAIGTKVKTVGESATSMGYGAEASSKGAVAIGLDSRAGDGNAATGTAGANGINAVAIGTGAQAIAKNTISIGTGNVVSGVGSGAIGDPTTITGTGTYSLGNDNGNIAASNSGVFGNNNNIKGATSGNRVIGNNNTVEVTANNALIFGNNAGVSAANGIAIGEKSASTSEGSIAFGLNSKAGNGSGATFGLAKDAIAIGTNSSARGDKAVAIGKGTQANHDSNIAIGNSAETGRDLTVSNYDIKNISIGYEAGKGMNGQFNSYLGTNAGQDSKGDGNSAFGLRAGKTVTGNTNTAIGMDSGQNVKASSNTAIGLNAGQNVTANGGGSNVAIGTNAGQNVTTTSSGGGDNIAIGTNAGRNVTSSIGHNTAVGHSAGQNIIGTNNVAFGSGSGQNVVGDNNTSMGINAGIGVKSSSNVSIGSDSGQNTDGVGNTAIGYQAGQKVTGGHNISMGYQSAKGLNGGSNTIIGFQAGQEIVGGNNIIVGTNATKKVTVDNVVSIGTNSTASTNNSVAVGSYSKATGNAAIAIGQGSNASKDNSMAIGNRSTVNAVKDVAIGSDSSTSATTGVSKATITVPGTGKSITYGTFAGSNPDAAFSVGSAGRERQIQNVAAGRVTATSTDAINGSQLFAVANELGKTWKANAGGNLSGSATSTQVMPGDEVQFVAGKNLEVEQNLATGSQKYTYSLKKDVDLGSTGSLKVGPVTINNNGIDAGNKKITNVAPGTADTDAANVSQVKAAKTTVSSDDNSITVTETTKPDGHKNYDLSVDVTKLDAANKSLSNINNDGNKVISGIARKSIDVVAGTNIKDIVKNDVQNSDGTTTTTYTINANGARVVAGDGVTVATGTPGSNNITDYTVSVKNTTLTATPGSTTVTAGDNNSYAKAGDVATAITNAAKAAKTEVKSPDSSINVATDNTSPDGHTIYNITIDKSGKVAAGDTKLVTGDTVNTAITNAKTDLINNNPLKFGGDSGTVVTRKLGDQLNIKGGATGATTSGNIAVIADGNNTLNIQLAKNLTGLDSISTNGGNTVINDNGITTPKVTINNAPIAGTDATNKDYVDSTKTKVTSNDSSVVINKTTSGNQDVYDLSVDVTKLDAANKSLSNINNDGNKVISDIARNSVDVIAGTNIKDVTKANTTNPDGTTKTTYTINANGARVVAGDGVTVATGTPGSDNITDYTVSVKNTTLTATPGSTTVTAGDNNSYAKAGDVATAITNVGKASKTTVTSNDSSVTVVSKVDSGDGHVNYDLSVDTSKVAANTNLTYKANSGTGLTTTLANGLDFKDGDNTVATVGPNGEVKYSLNPTVAGINSITTNGGNTVINDNGITTPKVTINNAPTAGTDATNKDYVDSTKTKVTSNDSSVVVNKTTSGNQDIYDLSVDVTKLDAANKSLSNINNAGNKVISDIARKSIDVVAGTNIKDIVKNDVQNSDGTTTTTYTINANGARVVAGDGVTVATGTPGSNNITDYTVSVKNTTLTAAPGSTTVTAGDNNSYAKAGDVATAITNVGKASKTTVTSNDSSVTVVSKVDSGDGHVNYDLSVDTSKVAANTNLTYKANSGTGLTTTLANGLDFKDGDNTKATVGPNGEVKYSLNPTVAGINSITTNGGNTVINDNGITTPKVTINNAPTAGTDATNKDYVDSTKTKVTSNDSSVVINKTTSGNQDIYDLSVDVTKLDAANKSLSNINNDGNKVISGIARKSIDVVAGTNIKDIVKNDVQNSDGTTTTTYTINANGARVVAGDGVTVATGTPGSNNITDYTVSVKNTTLTATPGSTTVTAGDNNSYAKAGDVATAITNVGKASKTTVTSNDSSVTVVSKVDSGDGHVNYDLSVDTSKVAANTNLTYKANSGTGLTTTLANGLDFKDGDNTKATVGPNGEVKYSLNPTVTGINSISTNGGNTVINDNGITTPKVTINNAPTAGTDATNKDYVDSTKTKVTSNDSSVVINKTTSGNQDVYDLSVDVTKLDAANKSLSNINNDGNKVISDIARNSVDVIAGTNIKDVTKANTTNPDGTTKTTYTINANGARVVAGDGVTVATGTPGSDNITDYTVSVKNTTLTATPGSTTVTAGDNNSYAKAGDVATAITNVGKASKTTVTSNDSSVTVVSKVDSGDGHVNYDLSVDTSKVAANTNLTYKANSGTGLTTTLANGLDFKDGDNTKATVGPNGEVKYSLNPTVAGINSITTNGGNTVINDNGVTTPSLTLTNSTPLTSSTGGKVTVPAGTGNQAVTGQTVANAINKLGDNTINLKASDGNITTKQSLNKDGGLEFNITGSNGITTTASGDTINVTIAQSGLNTSTTGGKTTVTPVTSGNTYATAGDVATAIQNAVNNSGWNAVAGSTGTGTTSGSVSNKLITPGETVKLQAGDNLNVDQSGGTFTYSLKKDISLDSVTTGDTKVANGGITIGTGSNQVSLTNNGLNNGGNKITNVAAGTNKNDAVNVGQLNAAKTELENGTNTTVSSRTGSNGQTIYKVNTDFTSIADAIGGNTKFDPTTGKIDTSAANIGGTGQTNISDAVKAAITTVSSNDASVTVNKVQKSDGHYNYDLSVDTNKIAANTNLTYKANSGTGLTTTLANGLDFKDGDNTKATVGPNGEVKYSLNPTVAGINSITTNGGNTVINDNGVTTPSLTLTNSTPLTSSTGGKVTVPAGTGNQAVTGQTVANAINKLGDNTINLKASDGNITTKQSLNKDGGLEFNITGSNGITTTASGDTINVTIAQSGLNTSTTGGKTTVTPVTGGNTYATAGDVATAIQNAVNNSGWNAVAGSTGTGTTSGSVSNKLITPGETVKLQAGDNLNVDQSGGTFTYNLKNDINVNSITAGNNKFDTSGLAISDAAGNKAITTPSGTTYTNAAGNTTVINPTGVVINKSAADPSKSVSLTDNGLDNGGNKITNVAAGVNPTDAVNVSQLDKAINKSTYNGPVVYTNAAGEKIVKVNGNYYKASDVDVNGNLLPGAVAINPSDIQHSLLNADGSTTNPSTLDNVGKGKISSSSKQAINGSQLNNLGTQLGLTVDPSGTGFSNPTFAGLKNVNGSTGAAPTTFKDAVDQTIAKVNEGIIYGADNNTAGTRQQLGSRLTVESGDFASGGVNYKGQNLETSYVSDGAGNGKIIVGITENPEFNSVKAKTFTADDGAGNTTVTNGQGTTITDAAGNKNVATAAGNTYTNAAGNTTTVNSSGVTINKSAADPSKSVSLTNSGLDNGGNRITNIAAGVAPTDAVNVSQLGNAVNNLTTTINASKSEVVGGTNTNVTSSTGSNGQIVYKVDADGTTVSGGSSFVSVTQGTKDANNITDYKIDLAQGTKDKLNSIGTGNIAAGDNNTVTGSTVHNYIQNNPLTYTDDNGTTVTRNLGQNLNIMGRATGPLTTGNIGVVAAGPDTLELRLAENVDLGPNGRVTMGKTVVNDDGIKITGGPSVTSSGIDAGGKKVTNIAEGDISPTSNDAVTGRQVYNAISAGAADKATRAELAGVNNNLTAGIAGVAAMANLPQINDSASNRFNIAVAGGAYKNGRAMALGFSGVSDGGRFVYRASASLNNKRDVAVGLGVGYQFGKRDVMPNELDRMKSMVALIEEQKDSYSRQLKQQLEQESRKNQENSELIRQLMQEVQELKSKSNVSNRSNRS
ncbi:YadA-like family protein [Leptotrichia sp. oral taxon 417]|uniref:YadA-like family protein n=1 Tax=Leptotrichia sp. oral taxon 417 TaxID=712365 RepID=UPI0015BC0739|nr:YadA-like family protein [Leptotrichia sp. oral taxon 417]NWO27313.1 YadA-like family protein [Leptotrichia sp. oral taxon 417]